MYAHRIPTALLGFTAAVACVDNGSGAAVRGTARKCAEERAGEPSVIKTLVESL